MLLLLLCFDIVATYVDNHNGVIGIKYKQQQNKRLAEKKRNKIAKEKLNLKTQSIDRLYLPSDVAAASVL